MSTSVAHCFIPDGSRTNDCRAELKVWLIFVQQVLDASRLSHEPSC